METKIYVNPNTQLSLSLSQYAKARFPPPLLPPRAEDADDEDDDDDGGDDEVAANEQLYSMVQPLFAAAPSSSSMKICLYLQSSLQNALSPLHQYHFISIN